MIPAVPTIYLRLLSRPCWTAVWNPTFHPRRSRKHVVFRGPQDPSSTVRDLRNLLWCSIDNDDSKDLDQLTVAERIPSGMTKVLVAIADVAAARSHFIAD